jgi:hypothetical protein
MGLPLALARFSSEGEVIFRVVALAAYIFAAVSGLTSTGRRSSLAIGLIALGLFLWHFPQLWNQFEGAYT